MALFAPRLFTVHVARSPRTSAEDEELADVGGVEQNVRLVQNGAELQMYLRSGLSLWKSLSMLC